MPIASPLEVPCPLQVEVDRHQSRSADLAALMPGVNRNEDTVMFDAETMTAAYGMLQVVVAHQNGP